MSTATLTLVGAADPYRATVTELRAAFGPEDRIICRYDAGLKWHSLYSPWWDFIHDGDVEVEWAQGD